MNATQFENSFYLAITFSLLLIIVLYFLFLRNLKKQK